jgi:hypothetical protein
VIIIELPATGSASERDQDEFEKARAEALEARGRNGTGTGTMSQPAETMRLKPQRGPQTSFLASDADIVSTVGRLGPGRALDSCSGRCGG